MEKPLVAIIGPTAVGKTGLVLRLADRFGAEVVSVDSMQVYRHMDIGTAKPTKIEQNRVRHHLIDIVDPDEEYNVSSFIRDAEKVCSGIVSRQKLPLLTGGTGLYLKGFQEGIFDLDAEGIIEKDIAGNGIADNLKKELDQKGRAVLYEKLQSCDPESAARIHNNDTFRLIRALEVFEKTGIPWSTHIARQKEKSKTSKLILKIGLACDRNILYERINQRTAKMFEIGLVEEVKNLLETGYERDLKSMQSIGYRHAASYIFKEWDLEQAISQMARDTRHYAKRQFTWFRKDPNIQWFAPDQDREISEQIDKYIQKNI